MLEPQTVNLAMEQARGNKTLAAKLLNVPRHEVENSIKADPTMSARWGNGAGGQARHKTAVEAPAESVTYHREALPEMPSDVLESEIEIAQAVRREEEQLLKDPDLAKMGFDGDMVRLAAACRSFTTKHYMKLTEMQSGGINRQFFKVIVALDKIDKRLEAIDQQEKPDLNEKMMLLIHRKDLLNWLVRARDSTSRAFLADAKVFEIRNQGKNKGKPRPRSYLAIKGADEND